MKCPKCGRELQIRKENSGKDENGNPVSAEYAVCKECRKKWNLDKMKNKKQKAETAKVQEEDAEVIKKALEEEAPAYTNIPPKEIREAREESMKKSYDDMLSAGVQEEKKPGKKLSPGGKKAVIAVAITVVAVILVVGYLKQDAIKSKFGIGTSVGRSDEEKDDGIIDFEAHTFTLKYVKHELGTDYEGNPCLFVHYSFKNTGEENLVPMAAVALKATQNGSDCLAAVVMDANEEIDNYMQEVEPGKEVQVCQAYTVPDNTEVTIEASELVTIDEEDDVQVLKLK